MYEAKVHETDHEPFYITPKGYSKIAPLFKLLGFVPKIKTISTNVPELIANNERLKSTVLFGSRVDYARASVELAARIAAYKLRELDLEDGKTEETFTFHETRGQLPGPRTPSAGGGFRTLAPRGLPRNRCRCGHDGPRSGQILRPRPNGPLDLARGALPRRGFGAGRADTPGAPQPRARRVPEHAGQSRGFPSRPTSPLRSKRRPRMARSPRRSRASPNRCARRSSCPVRSSRPAWPALVLSGQARSPRRQWLLPQLRSERKSEGAFGEDKLRVFNNAMAAAVPWLRETAHENQRKVSLRQDRVPSRDQP